MRRTGGFSLIELMVSMAIGMIVIAGAMMVFGNTTQSGRLSQTESQMTENAAIALNILQQQIRLAGYGAIVGSSTFTVRKNFAGAGIRGCDGGFTSAANAAFASVACAADTDPHDALIVRFEADAGNSSMTGTRPINCVGDGISSSTTSDVTNTLPNYARADNRYYIQTTGTPSGQPELYCTGAIGTPTSATFGTAQPLLPGIEEMHLKYGMATTSTGTVSVAYMTATDIDTQYSTETVDVRWSRVMSVRICIIVASEVKGSELDGSYKDCGNTAQTSSDGRLRRAYSTTVALRNRGT